MFFLRCVFFLSIVYVSISCDFGSLHGPHAFQATIAGEAAGVADVAVTRVIDWCAVSPAQCVRDAARLTALVRTAVAEPVAGTEDVLPSNVEASYAPMPVPDPRRRAARAMLTDAR